MSRDDETAFLAQVKGTGRAELFPSVLETERPEPVLALPDKVSATLAEKRFFFFNHEVSSRLFSIRSKDASHYSFDWMRSSAIEYQRCVIDEEVMYPGRIFADFTYYDMKSNSMVTKELEFEKWYESLAKWIKKSYHPIRLYDPGRSKVPSWILYAGPGAQSFNKAGGKFSVNPPGGRTIILIDLEGKRTTLETPRE